MINRKTGIDISTVPRWSYYYCNVAEMSAGWCTARRWARDFSRQNFTNARSIKFETRITLARQCNSKLIRSAHWREFFGNSVSFRNTARARRSSQLLSNATFDAKRIIEIIRSFFHWVWPYHRRIPHHRFHSNTRKDSAAEFAHFTLNFKGKQCFSCIVFYSRR